ncbi:MAG: hypothetical protein WBV55_23785 [Candidatus Sulfotelmatobacter sp.]
MVNDYGQTGSDGSVRFLENEINSVGEHLDIGNFLKRVSEGIVYFASDYDSFYFLAHFRGVLFNPCHISKDLADSRIACLALLQLDHDQITALCVFAEEVNAPLAGRKLPPAFLLGCVPLKASAEIDVTPILVHKFFEVRFKCKFRA